MENIAYLMVLLVPTILLFAYQDRKHENKALAAILFSYLLLASLRGNGSGDYFNYINAVPLMDSLSKVINPGDYPFEIGFRVISYVNNIFNLNPQFTIAILNFISLSTVFYTIYKFSNNKRLSAFLYFSFLLIFDMHHTRSAVAMNFFFLSSLFMFQKKYLKTLIFSVLSITFHKTAIIPLAIIYLYFGFKELLKRKKVAFRLSELKRNHWYLKYAGPIVIFFLILFVIFVSPIDIMRDIIKLFPDNIFKKKFLSYVSNDRWSYSFSLLDPRFILILFTYIGAVLIKFKNRLYVYYKDMIFIAIVILLVLSNSTMLVMRFYNFFNLFTILLIPILLLEAKNKLSKERYKLIYYLTLVVYLIYFVALCFRQVPYFFFF